MPAVASRLYATVDPYPVTPNASGGYSVLDSRTIWNADVYQAFTGLCRASRIGGAYGTLFSVHRMGTTHTSRDGQIRVLRSRDGLSFTPAALLSSPYSDKKDQRDPKMIETASGGLMINTVATDGAAQYQSLAWFSANGNDWMPQPLTGLTANDWLWRVTLGPDGLYYGFGYGALGNPPLITLYRSPDGKAYDPITTPSALGGTLNGAAWSESALVFLADGSALAVLRGDGGVTWSLIGTAPAPYTNWTWQASSPTTPGGGSRVGSPALAVLPDGRILLACRMYVPSQRVSLCTVSGTTITEVLSLYGNYADTGYPGILWWRGMAWLSYYRDGGAGIDLARVGVN